MLAQAVADLLDRRNLTVNGAHMRTGISREVITKLTLGQRPELEVLEKFARAFGEDVNEFRRLAGYPPLEDSRPPVDRIREAADELTYIPETDDWGVAAYGGSVSPEDQERLRKIATALRDTNRRIAE